MLNIYIVIRVVIRIGTEYTPWRGIHFTWFNKDDTVGAAACGLFACFNVLTGYGYEFDPMKELPGYNWPANMDAVKNLMEEKGVTGQLVSSTNKTAIDEALNEGRPVILLFNSNTDKQGVQWTTGGHFVAFVGKDSEGNILSLDSASSGNMNRENYPGTVEDMSDAFQAQPVWIADEAPTGIAKKSEAKAYEGYEGNEAVVSPVTGILLDYGTYEKVDTTNLTDDDGNKITTEDSRVNVDLKYGYTNIYENLSDNSGSSEKRKWR